MTKSHFRLIMPCLSCLKEVLKLIVNCNMAISGSLGFWLLRIIRSHLLHGLARCIKCPISFVWLCPTGSFLFIKCISRKNILSPMEINVSREPGEIIFVGNGKYVSLSDYLIKD